MSDVEQRIISGRTAALTVALRRGDAFGAARAAARLRLPGVPLTRRQLAMARRARSAVGRSLVHARYFPTTHRDVIVPPTPRRLARRVLDSRWLVIPLIAAIVVLVVLLSRPAGPDAGSSAAAPNVPTTIDQTRDHLRGRTSAAPPVVVVATPPPSTTPAPTSTPNPIGSPGASPGPGSSGGGLGTGGGGGGLGGGPTAPPGFRIFTLDVFDGDTGKPLPNVCVNIGQPTCDAAHLTNEFGRWTWPISKSDTTKWDMTLTLVRYNTWKQSFLVLPQDEPHKVVNIDPAVATQ